MQFEKGHLYHIYNQGNNRQKIFFEKENYLFFLKKVRVYILPYADILAWCLMPNHFHLMVKVNRVEIDKRETLLGTTHRVTPSHPVSDSRSCRTLNQSIAIMLRSYTRAVNKQLKNTGSLFREETKAECLTTDTGITPSFYNTKSGTQIHVDHPENQYPQICFDYIHKNPVVAGLVAKAIDWEFSSAKDYAGLRDGKLVNREVATEYVNINGGAT